MASTPLLSFATWPPGLPPRTGRIRGNAPLARECRAALLAVLGVEPADADDELAELLRNMGPS